MRVTVFVLGALLIVLGAVLVVLPGPLTIPPMLLGLFVWSLEFAFAERLLARARTSASAAAEAARRRPWRTGVVTGAGLLLAVAAAVLAGRYGIDGVLERVRRAGS